MPDVFLSYARADDDPDYDNPAKSFMRRLYTALTAEGFDVWWDREKLPARSLTFTDEIEIAIRACDRFVLIAGPGAKTSDYVAAEWMFALAQCKPITPALRVGDYAIIPPEIAGINAIDCRPTRDETAAFKDIINRLREDAPLGKKIGGKGLPRGYVNRPAPFKAARDALMADAIQTTVTVISAPQRETKPGREAEPQQTVSVYGLGGIGKSTLAAALTDDCDIRRHFRDGVIWLEVGQTPIVASLQAWIGVHFGDNRDNYQNEDDGTRSLSLVLHDKAALLVLDDVWDHKIVERFPVGGTACRLLITTRSGALAGRVEGADVRLDLLTPDEGAQVIAGRTGKNADDRLYRQISETLGGHTLAVTLAALQIAEGYADDAADLLRLLEKQSASGEPFRDLAVDADDKDLNLALSLSLSYDALKDDDLRRRFRATGIFALEGSFDRAALAAIWADADEDDARGALRALVGAGLLDEALTPQPPLPQGEGEQEEDEVSENTSGATKGRGGVRYSQHRLLRAYARALLAEESELESTFERYAEYVIALAGIFRKLGPHERSQLDADFVHIDVIGDELTRRFQINSDESILQDLVGRFAWNVMPYINHRRQAIQTKAGITLRGLDWLEAGLKVYLSQGNQSKQATTLNNIGGVWDDLGEQKKALGYFEQTLPLRRTIGDQYGEAITLNNIGKVWDSLGNSLKALDYYEQALDLQRETGNQSGEATTLNNIGGIWSVRGDTQKALGYYERALLLRRASGDERGEATTLNNIGAAWNRLGHKQKALDYYTQVLRLVSNVGDQRGESVALNNIGMVWNDLGEKKKALDYYERALLLRCEIGDQRGEATTLNNIAQIYFQEGDIKSATEILARAIPIAQKIGAIMEEASFRYNLAFALQELNQIDEAIAHIEFSIQLLDARGLDRAAFGINLNQMQEFLAQLRGDMQSPQNANASLPYETIQLLCQNTYAVKTTERDKHDERRDELQGIIQLWSNMGEDWTAEVRFAEALLAILNDTPINLPDDNPYAEAVRQVVDVVNIYKS